MFSPEFPDPQHHAFPLWILDGDYFYDGSDIISLGNALTVDNVRQAYTNGIFPWHIDGMPLPWYYLRSKTCDLKFNDLHIPRSLAKILRNCPFTFTIDQDFSSVIKNCSKIARSGISQERG